MGIRDQAASDLRAVLEDQDGFGCPITVSDPSGNSACLTGFSADISAHIDIETGQLVSGRRASVVLSLSTLSDAGLDIPRGIAAPDSRPWVVEFLDVQGEGHTFKVMETMPDRTIGCVVCILEAYNPVPSSPQDS